MVNLNLFQLVLSQCVVDVDLRQFGGGGLGIFFKSTPISCNVWHSLLLGQRLVAIKRGSHCGEPMEHLSSPQRVWTRKNESGERPARPQLM